MSYKSVPASASTTMKFKKLRHITLIMFLVEQRKHLPSGECTSPLRLPETQSLIHICTGGPSLQVFYDLCCITVGKLPDLTLILPTVISRFVHIYCWRLSSSPGVFPYHVVTLTSPSSSFDTLERPLLSIVVICCRLFALYKTFLYHARYKPRQITVFNFMHYILIF